MGIVTKTSKYSSDIWIPDRDAMSRVNCTLKCVHCTALRYCANTNYNSHFNKDKMKLNHDYVLRCFQVW